MKKITIVIMMLLLSLGLCTSGAWGVIESYPDQTLARKYQDQGTNPPIATATWQDVIGVSTFDTFGATYDTVAKKLKIYTNWNEGTSISSPTNGLFTTAFLFLDLQPVVSPGQPVYDVAINLDVAGTTSHAKFIAPLTIQTSLDVLNGFTTVADFGGKYTTNKNVAGPPEFDVPVLATATQSGTAPVVWATNVANAFGGANCNTVEIDLSAIVGAGKFDYLWGTATCANDVIYATVPVPGALLLLGAGLLRLAGHMRSRRVI